MRGKEMEQMRVIEELREKLEQAVTHGVESGNLDEAIKMRAEIEQRLKDSIKENKIGRLWPEVRKLVEENRADFFSVVIGGKNRRQLRNEMKAKSINISSLADDLIESEYFETLAEPEELSLVTLTLADLGLSGGGNIDRIYERAKWYGLRLCPAEVGPHLRLNYLDQPEDEWLFIAMNQIQDRLDDERIFCVGAISSELWLTGVWMEYGWTPNSRFVFRV